MWARTSANQEEALWKQHGWARWALWWRTWNPPRPSTPFCIQYADIIVGRLGIPYRQRGVAIIALAVDGSMENISAMTGKLGQIPHVSVKSAITKN